MLTHLMSQGTAPRGRPRPLLRERRENQLGLPRRSGRTVIGDQQITVLAVVMIAFVQTAKADLYVASANTNSVIRYNEVTGDYLDNFVYSGSGGLSVPKGLLFGVDGNLYVNSANTDSVMRFSGTTGDPLPAPGKPDAIFVTPGDGGLQSPAGLILGRDGNLYVASQANHSVLRYSGTTGDFIDAFVPTGSGGLHLPRLLVFGPDGNLYVNNDNSVLRFDGTTGAPLPAPGQTGAVFVSGLGQLQVGLVFGKDGNLYVADFNGNSVLRFDGTTGTFLDTFISPRSGGLDGPNSLVFGPDNNLYVSSFNLNSVLRYSGTTGAFIDVFIPAGSGGLNGQTGMIFTNTDPTTLAYVPPPRSQFLIGAPMAPVSGTPFDITVTALDPSGNIDTAYQGTVTFSTSDPDSGVVLPGEYTFRTGDGGDNGVHAFPGGVTLVTQGDQTLTVTDKVTGLTGSVTITVGPGP